MGQHPNGSGGGVITEDCSKTSQEKLEIFNKFDSIRKSCDFWLLFMIECYILGMPSFFLINIKNFGYENFDDQTLTNISSFAAAMAIISRLGTGWCIDKFGPFIIIRVCII